jgi:hypothetical protein
MFVFRLAHHLAVHAQKQGIPNSWLALVSGQLATFRECDAHITVSFLVLGGIWLYADLAKHGYLYPGKAW